MVKPCSWIIASFAFYRLEQKRRETKTLDYTIHGMQDLTGRLNRTSIKINEKSKEERPPKEPRIVNYRISNTGNWAIQADDFKRPIEVSVAKGSIVDVVVTNMSHIGILEFGPIPGDSPTNRVFTPLLLNKGDWIDIKVITDGCLDLPKIDSWFLNSRGTCRDVEVASIPFCVKVSRSNLCEKF